MAVVHRGGLRPLQDWALLLAQYEADYAPHLKTIREFCADREVPLPYQVTVNAFMRERKRNTMAAFHARNKPLLLTAQNKVAESLEQSDQWEDKVQAANFRLKVLEKVSEREEPNPMLTQVNVVIPPLFPESALAAKAIEAITGQQAKPKRMEERNEAPIRVTPEADED